MAFPGHPPHLVYPDLLADAASQKEKDDDPREAPVPPHGEVEAQEDEDSERHENRQSNTLIQLWLTEEDWR